jgi:hypothetical protein
MKIKAVVVLLIVGIVVLAKVSTKENFSQAKDFPNGALVYLQVADLHQFITLLNNSAAKEKYLESQNFADFQTSHLGIKLAERLNDFSYSIGFPIDLQTLSSLAEKQAAVAVYDIGKLDFVLVAPMNKELFSATMFAQNSSKFEENKLEDGTSFYQIEFKVDRERQNQKLIFANIKGRFVLAASEKLFFRTIAAINGKQRLYDEQDFKKLSEQTTPTLATIWVNQERLNADYYFKRYWLMSKVEDLQNIRAGIFDLDLNEKGLTEKRIFLLKEPPISSNISNREADDLVAKIPDDVPFYRLQKVEESNLGEVIYATLFDRQMIDEMPRKRSNDWSYSDYDDYYQGDSDYDKAINQVEDDEIIETKLFSFSKISDSLKSANPSAILTATTPKVLESPLFAEFRKVGIISLKNPSGFRADDFEKAIIDGLKNRVTVADTSFDWTTDDGLRKLNIPMLGWEIGYLVKDDKMFVSNSFEFLSSVAANQNKTKSHKDSFDDLTLIRLKNHEQNFEGIMEQLSGEDGDFFLGNISSLLDVMKDVKQIEIRRDEDKGFLREEIFIKTQTE